MLDDSYKKKVERYKFEVLNNLQAIDYFTELERLYALRDAAYTLSMYTDGEYYQVLIQFLHKIKPALKPTFEYCLTVEAEMLESSRPGYKFMDVACPFGVKIRENGKDIFIYHTYYSIN